MPAAAARELSAAWEPDRYPALFLRQARAYARGVLRELPGSDDDLRSTHSVSLPGTERGSLRLSLILRRCADAKRAWPPCRIASCQARSVTHASLGAGTAAALVMHRTFDAL